MLKPKKSLGQNFLIDKNICKKIVKITKIENHEILEIGAGTGFLTDEIIKKKPAKLTIIEKDHSLYQLLKKKYQNTKNLHVYNYDALKFDYKKINNNSKIISNLPYNISIKLITNWLKINNYFDEMILMIQKEVAEKMNYKNINKNNRLSFFIEISSDYNIEFNVSKNVFFPKPKIQSSVIKIIPKKNLNIDLNKIEVFTREIFKFKRKKLSNVINLDNINDNLINKIKNKRAEDLSSKELMNIFNKFYNF